MMRVISVCICMSITKAANSIFAWIFNIRPSSIGDAGKEGGSSIIPGVVSLSVGISIFLLELLFVEVASAAFTAFRRHAGVATVESPQLLPASGLCLFHLGSPADELDGDGKWWLILF